MINPILRENEWVPLLSGLPQWQPSLNRTLVVSPHPDDETLGAGGLIALLRSRGVDVTVVAVTDGEGAYADVPRLAAIREREQTEALERLGVDSRNILRLRFPDRNVSEFEPLLVEFLLSLLAEGMHLIAPWPRDFHPDHEACGRAANEAAQRVKIQLTSYFFWTWHHGTVKLLEDLPLVSLPLDPALLAARQEALECHRSQLHHDGGQPILPESLLGPVSRPYEVFLPS